MMNNSVHSGQQITYGPSQGEQSNFSEQTPLSGFPLADSWSGLVFRGLCPGCGKDSRLSYGTACSNWLPRQNRTCGYRLPREMSDLYSKMSEKVEKHTTRPTEEFRGVRSCSPDGELYLDCRVRASISGAIYLNTDEGNGYFASFVTPSGAIQIADVFEGSPHNSTPASGFLMPINSNLHELHGRYCNFCPNWVYVCPAQGTVIEYKNEDHPNTFQIFRSGEQSPFAEWNPSQKTGFVGTIRIAM